MSNTRERTKHPAPGRLRSPTEALDRAGLSGLLEGWRDYVDSLPYDGAQVYFAQREDGLIKIGWVMCATPGTQRRHVEQKVNASLRYYRNPQHLSSRLLAYWPGDRDVKEWLCAHFAAAQVDGDWFAPTSDLLGFIEQVISAQHSTT